MTADDRLFFMSIMSGLTEEKRFFFHSPDIHWTNITKGHLKMYAFQMFTYLSVARTKYQTIFT